MRTWWSSFKLLPRDESIDKWSLSGSSPNFLPENCVAKPLRRRRHFRLISLEIISLKMTLAIKCYNHGEMLWLHLGNAGKNNVLPGLPTWLFRRNGHLACTVGTNFPIESSFCAISKNGTTPKTRIDKGKFPPIQTVRTCNNSDFDSFSRGPIINDLCVTKMFPVVRSSSFCVPSFSRTLISMNDWTICGQHKTLL